MNQPLASYAAIDEQSRGRRFPEPPPRFRSEFQRDRDRIIHCNAFRRLVYKTQVFVNHEGDLYRTRITHSLEVAQIGRTVARALRINETLTEAICLAHDLGHTPFGHAGQDALNECMREYGGFEHNLQSLRVVDELEERYASFSGLNLTFECREGILKHCSVAERAQARRCRRAVPQANTARPGGAARQPCRCDRLQQPRRRRWRARRAHQYRGTARSPRLFAVPCRRGQRVSGCLRAATAIRDNSSYGRLPRE